MIDLHKQSGLPMLWDPAAKQIVFKEEAAGNEAPPPDVRRRQDMREVLFDRQAADIDELYYMYRGVALEPVSYTHLSRHQYLSLFQGGDEP